MLDAAPAIRAVMPSFAGGAATRKVIALVGMQLSETTGAACRAFPHQWARHRPTARRSPTVPIGTGDAEHQRDALAVRDDVALAAVCPCPLVGAGDIPRAGYAGAIHAGAAEVQFAGAAHPSSSSRCRRCHTPAVCQSRRRRQHVMPLPKPSSWGGVLPGCPCARRTRCRSEPSVAHPWTTALGRWHEHWQHRLDLPLNNAALISLFRL